MSGPARKGEAARRYRRSQQKCRSAVGCGRAGWRSACRQDAWPRDPRCADAGPAAVVAAHLLGPDFYHRLRHGVGLAQARN